MRITHNLWKVSNGWILVPEGDDSVLTPEKAAGAAVFKNLEEFCKWTPKQKRNRKPKTKPLEVHPAGNPNIK